MVVRVLQPKIACNKFLTASEIWDDHLIVWLLLWPTSTNQPTNQQKWSMKWCTDQCHMGAKPKQTDSLQLAVVMKQVPRMWDFDKEDNLLEQWQQRPCLYDMPSSSYHLKRDEAWRGTVAECSSQVSNFMMAFYSCTLTSIHEHCRPQFSLHFHRGICTQTFLLYPRW